MLTTKKGLNSGKNCRKILIIELNLDTPKIHLHTKPSFNPTFRSQVIIRKPIWDGRTDDTHYYSPPLTKHWGIINNSMALKRKVITSSLQENTPVL